MKIDMHIELVGSGNPRLNAMTAEAQQHLLATLKKQYKKVSITIVNTMPDLVALVAKRPDLVVLGMKLVLLDPSMGYDDSPKVWLSDYLTAHGIGYTGSDTASLQLEFDKPVAKQNVIDAGLESAAYFISTIKAPTFEHGLTYPLFVKPTNRGDSKGIDERSVVHSQAELESMIAAIHEECDSDVLVEEYLSGREFSVAVIDYGMMGGLVAMPIEIVSPIDRNGNSFLSASVKSADLEQVVAVTDLELKQAINELAIGTFKSLGARDYGRIDVRLDARGVPSFIEANLMPGLSAHGYLARCFYLNNKISYDEMVFSIVEPAALRVARASIAAPSEMMVKKLTGVSVVMPEPFVG